MCEEETERCQHCDYEYPIVWHAPDEIWQAVTGITDGSGLFCIDCFTEMAWEKDLMLYWECATGCYPTLFRKPEAADL